MQFYILTRDDNRELRFLLCSFIYGFTSKVDKHTTMISVQFQA